MNDEFDVVVDDDTAADVAQLIMEMKEQTARQDFSSIQDLWEKYQKKSQQKSATAAMFKQVEAKDEDQETDDEEDDESDESDDDEWIYAWDAWNAGYACASDHWQFDVGMAIDASDVPDGAWPDAFTWPVYGPTSCRSSLICCASTSDDVRQASLSNGGCSTSYGCSGGGMGSRIYHWVY